MLPFTIGATITNMESNTITKGNQRFEYRGQGFLTRSTSQGQQVRHPDFVDRAKRLFSYTRWRFSHIQDPTKLANIGFFYTEEGDLVRCFSCSLGLKDFISTDDPLVEHVRHSDGRCEFLIQLLGPSRLREIKERFKLDGAVGQTASEPKEPIPSNRGNTHDFRELNTPKNKVQCNVKTHRRPEYSSYSVRVSSYSGWPTYLVQTPQKLAEAGFYYTVESAKPIQQNSQQENDGLAFDEDLNGMISAFEAMYIGQRLTVLPQSNTSSPTILCGVGSMHHNSYQELGQSQTNVQVKAIQIGLNTRNMGQVVQQNSHQKVGQSPTDVQVQAIQTGLNTSTMGHSLQTQGVQQNRRGTTTQANENSELPVYNMSRNPRGFVVIINNKFFYQMPYRLGTDEDAERLQRVFRTLGFQVHRRNDLTNVDMVMLLTEVAEKVNHTNFDCFVCCILTHGDLNHLYGTNGKPISIRTLTSIFQSNRCPSLTGKPKLFFLQACQGLDRMTVADASGFQDIETDNNDTDFDKEIIPNEADFLIGYATLPGYVCFRSRTQGSWYIQRLCELLEKLSHKEHLVDILVHVNYAVSEANANLTDGTFKQMPAFLSSLRKQLYLGDKGEMTNVWFRDLGFVYHAT